MTHWIQSDFSGGQISPRMKMNLAAPERANAVASSLNMYATPQGTIKKRNGFDYVAEFPVGIETIRIFNFNVGFDQSFIVAVNELEIQILDRNGFVYQSEQVTNGSFAQEGVGWTFNSQVSFSNGLAVITRTDGTGFIEQELTLTDAEEYTLSVYTDGGRARVKIGTTQDGSEIEFTEIIGPKNQFVFTAVGTSIWIRIEVLDQSGYNTCIVDAISCVSNATGIGGQWRFGHPWASTDLPTLHVAQAPGNNEMYFAHRNAPVQVLKYNQDTFLWEFDAAAFDYGDDGTGPPPVENNPPWDLQATGLQHPGTLDFHQGKLYLGGTWAEPVTIWASGNEGYLDFDIGDQNNQTAGDALVLPLDKRGQIAWIKSNRTLLIGLDTGEHIIFGQQGPIDVDDAQTEQNSSYGSSRIQAENLGGFTLFVDTEGKKVRASNYVRERQAWVPTDITYKAQNITPTPIIESAVGSAPQGFYLGLLANGRIIYSNAEFDRDIIGWHAWNIIGATVKSCTTLHEFGADVSWVAASYSDRIIIARQGPDFFTDFTIRQVLLEPANVFNGFFGLRGKTVQALVDGAVKKNVKIDTLGVIEFPENELYTEVIAGLPIPSLITTLPPYRETRDGFTHTHMKRFSDAYVNVLSSARPNFEIADVMFQRRALTRMDEPESLKTEWIKTAQSGFSKDKELYYSSLDPLPLEIRAIGGKLEENNT